MNHERKQVAGALLTCVVLLAVSVRAASGAPLLFEDFQGHANGSIVTSANGWTGTAVNVNDSANFGGSRVLDAIDATGTSDDFVFAQKALAGTLLGGQTYEMSMQVYAQTTSLPSHNNGMGLSSSLGANAFASSAYWAVIYDFNNVPGNTAYRFDVRELTGNGSAFFDILGPFDSVQTLGITLDGSSGEVYGQVDFGGGLQETTHYAVTDIQIAAIDQVFGYFDFRSANPGSPSATTGLGTQFGGAQWDNILVTGELDNAPVPEPTTVVLVGAGLVGTCLGRKRRKRVEAGPSR